MSKIVVIDGDATRVVTPALVTPIGSNGQWSSPIDQAILGSDRNRTFHDQANEQLPLRDGQIIYAPADGPHQGWFEAVLFVVDNHHLTTYSLIRDVLVAAEKLQLTSVVLPIGQLGHRPGASDGLADLVSAVSAFAHTERCVQTIYLVVDNHDDETAIQLTLH